MTKIPALVSALLVTALTSPRVSGQPLSDSVHSMEMTIHAPGVTLSGTLLQPAHSSTTAVLLISGSGPTDRNGNSPLLPGPNNSLLQLADSLAKHNIASLRYDKRGIAKSHPDSIFREDEMSFDLITGDALRMYQWLQRQGYTRIFIAGHSEGSLVGLVVAQQVQPAGMISLSGAGRKAGDILKEQTASLPPALHAELSQDLDSLEHGHMVSHVSPELFSLLRPSLQPYMKSWLPLNPAVLAASLHCPFLIIQGTKDLQITVADADKLHAAHPSSQLVVVSDMNHVLKKISTDLPADNISAYSDPRLPLPSEVVSSIVHFIGRP
jgi:uncharacterized protein